MKDWLIIHPQLNGTTNLWMAHWRMPVASQWLQSSAVQAGRFTHHYIGWMVNTHFTVCWLLNVHWIVCSKQKTKSIHTQCWAVQTRHLWVSSVKQLCWWWTVASNCGVNVISAAREPTAMMILYHRVWRKPSWLRSRMVGVLKTGLVRATAESD